MFGSACIAAAKRHAIEEYPRESVGMVIDGIYQRIKNESTDPHAVIFDERLALDHGPALQALIHSHPGGPNYPSYQDQVSQLAWGIPWGIIQCNAESAREPMFWGAGTPRPPLFINGRVARRGFCWVFFDCYALIMDIYREMLGINLKNFPREWGEWKQDPPRSSYDLHFAEAGFERTTRPKPFDVVVMRCGGKVTNHAGVLMPNNEIFHHVGNPEKPIDPSRFAVRESMGRWKRAIEGGYWLTYSKGIA